MIRDIRADNPGPFTLDGTRTWIIGDAVIVDPGPADHRHVDALLEAVPDPEAILVTHRHADHAGAIPLLRSRVSAPVHAPEGAVADARVVRGGEFLELAGITIEVVATPGHTGEHVCYLTSRGELFTGDTILGAGTTTIFPPDGNMTDYLESLALLLSREPAVIYPGHGPARHDAIELIREYIEHREMRSREILDALKSGPAGVRALREAVYLDLDPRLHGAAETQIGAHLEDLERRGLVRRSNAEFELDPR
ncbi:MAG: MBL fold metallo-hydrolase [Acidobacteria bacterium]|nr:MBL fold metallo-hydrolase [Acidobacteriota bacterium]